MAVKTIWTIDFSCGHTADRDLSDGAADGRASFARPAATPVAASASRSADWRAASSQGDGAGSLAPAVLATSTAAFREGNLGDRIETVSPVGRGRQRVDVQGWVVPPSVLAEQVLGEGDFVGGRDYAEMGVLGERDVRRAREGGTTRVG
jgi:hypothetical protein